jgi:hypothetical protein
MRDREKISNQQFLDVAARCTHLVRQFTIDGCLATALLL